MLGEQVSRGSGGLCLRGREGNRDTHIELIISDRADVSGAFAVCRLCAHPSAQNPSSGSCAHWIGVAGLP